MNITHRLVVDDLLHAFVEQELLPGTLSIIDATSQKKVIHDNTASRYKSSLARKVSALQQG